jgi:hypothetical protein
MQKGEITREEATCVLSAVQHLTAGDQLQLRNDIYDHDRAILAALAARRTALPR